MTKISKKLVIDIEQTKGAFGVFITDSAEKFDIVSAGKEITPLPAPERDRKIYRLLEEHCDLIFCTSQGLADFPFYPLPRFSIFAVDSKDNCFGTIGGFSSLVDDNYPVGYVGRNGMYGKIAGSLKEFLELVTFYPYWWDIVRDDHLGLSSNIDAVKVEKLENNPEYCARRQEIKETLQLSHNPKSLELLITNLQSPPEFVVYASKEEAQKTNTFWDKFFSTTLKPLLERQIGSEKSKPNKNRLLNKYKHKIAPGEKTIAELIDSLKSKVDTMEIDTSTEFSQFFRQSHLCNIVNCIRNQKLKLSCNDLDLVAYKIVKNDKSDSYYQGHSTQKSDVIHILFERRTGYIYSNNNKLLLELFIERGVSQYDYEHDTNLLRSYVFYLDSYSKGEY